MEKDGKQIGFPEDWQGYTVERNKFQGKYYGIQLHLTCAALLYNVDMLKEAGSQAAVNLAGVQGRREGHGEARQFGFAPNPTFYYYWSWLLQNGAKYYDPATNKVTLDTPEAAEAPAVPLRSHPCGQGRACAGRGRRLRGAAEAFHRRTGPP